MSLAANSRLGRVYPGLSARERAILVLGSVKNKTPEDPAWRRTMPQDQVKEFNRLIGLMNATNMYLPLYITMVEGMAKAEWVRMQWWSNMFCFGKALWDLGHLVPVSKRKEAEKAVAEVSAEFDGEDALRSAMRGVLEKARYEISLMHEWLSGKEAVENRVPSEESMELARTYFGKGIDLYERI